MFTLPDRRFLILFTLCCICGTFYASWMLGSLGIAQVPFDAEGWQNADPTDVECPVRSAMLDDLLARHDFTAWPQQKVLDLLGPPEPMCPESSAFDAVILVGPKGRTGSDFQWLAFRGDAQEKIVGYKVVTTGPIR